MFDGADVFRDSGGDLVLAVEQGSSGARDPCGEQTILLGSFRVDGFSLVIGKHIHLCITGLFVKGLLSVVVVFHVEYVGGDWEGCNGRTNRLEDVIVGAKEMEGRSLVVDCLEEVFYDGIIVHRDQKGWVGVGVRVHV
jgi:hypothetical protein